MKAKILCFLGFHNWKYVHTRNRCCINCNKIEDGVSNGLSHEWVSITNKAENFFLINEEFARKQHEIWAHWMKYQFRQCSKNEDGSFVIPAEKVQRWTRQMNTLYDNLSETEKQSDRDIVNIFLLGGILFDGKNNTSIKRLIGNNFDNKLNYPNVITLNGDTVKVNKGDFILINSDGVLGVEKR